MPLPFIKYRYVNLSNRPIKIILNNYIQLEDSHENKETTLFQVPECVLS